MCERKRRTTCFVASTREIWIDATSVREIVPWKGCSAIFRGSSGTKASARSSVQLPKGRSASIAFVDHSIGPPTIHSCKFHGLAFADNTSGSDEVKSATVHGTEPRTAPHVVWLQFCDLGGFAVGSRDCSHRPPRRTYSRVAPDVAICRYHAANRTRRDAAAGDRERPLSLA